MKNEDFSREFLFSASRSSGPGGQNVNKVSTKVELRFDILHSNLLSEEEKESLLSLLVKKINSEGILIIVSQSERTQLKNKEKTIEKFYTLLKKSLTSKKKRKPTRPNIAAIEKRLGEKKMNAEKKMRRKELERIRLTIDNYFAISRFHISPFIYREPIRCVSYPKPVCKVVEDMQ